MFQIMLQGFAYYVICCYILAFIIFVWGEITNLFGRHMNLKKYTKADYERWERIKYKGMI